MTSLGISAEEFYKQEQKGRTGPIEVARRLADLTIPSDFPTENWNSGDDLEITNQSINSRILNTLTSKLTLAALPPTLPFISYNPIETKLEEDIKNDPEAWSQVKYALSRREEVHRKRLKETEVRSAYGRGVKQLLLAGNVCVFYMDINHPRIYNMHSYIVKRSADGEPLVTIISEKISWAIADEDIKAAVKESRPNKDDDKSKKNDWHDTINIYHVQTLEIDEQTNEKEWHYWQETEGGHVVEGTDAWSEYEVPAMYPAGMKAETGSDWYIPYCLDYEGDLQAIENLSASIQDGAAALAWFLFFVNPEGMTNLKEVQEADSLDVLPGRADDVTTLNTHKGGELNAVSVQQQEAARRLGFAFASQTSIQRPGERVTAEEWQRMSQELDEVMGGLSTDLSQGYQKWWILRFIHLHELENKELAPLPEGLVSVDIVTGLDSIGQSTDHSNLIAWASEGAAALGPEGFNAKINGDDFLRRTAAGRAVKAEGLVKSPEQAQAEREQQEAKLQQQTLMEQATGPLAKEGAGMISEMLQSQQGTSDNG